MIISYFHKEKKLVKPIEKLDNLIESLPLSTVKIKDIVDDFKNVDSGSYPQNLEMMHKSFINNSMRKSITLL